MGNYKSVDANFRGHSAAMGGLRVLAIRGAHCAESRRTVRDAWRGSIRLDCEGNQPAVDDCTGRTHQKLWECITDDSRSSMRYRLSLFFPGGGLSSSLTGNLPEYKYTGCYFYSRRTTSIELQFLSELNKLQHSKHNRLLLYDTGRAALSGQLTEHGKYLRAWPRYITPSWGGYRQCWHSVVC